VARTSAHKRFRFLTAAAAVSLLATAGHPLGAAAAAARPASTPSGGSAAPSGGGTAPAPAKAPSGGGAAPAPAKKAPAHGHKASPPSPHVLSVHIYSAACVPAPRCSVEPRQVSVHGTLLLNGVGLQAGMTVAFPKARGASISRVSSPRSSLHNSSLGLVVTVPFAAHSGRIMILLSHGRYTSSYGPINVVHHALHPPKPKTPPPPVSTTAGSSAVSGTAFDGQGMWIWYVSASDGGNLASIVAQAHAVGVGTLFIKSSDGSSNYWSQFSTALVQQLHANGLKACAWQYVYGSNPAGEAALGAQAAAAGADCLVIDAESEYEGRYASAQTYIADLRARVGPNYPVGLASFPYVYYHTSFPYSVFLGPGGAQYNAPQMYWKDIGNSVDTVYANTYISNRIYGRPIFPLGQTYNHPSSSELVRFREEAVDYGATGLSWWDFQETPGSGWEALAAPLQALTSVTPNTTYPELSAGSRGDPVLWMQEHLATAVPAQETTGSFDSTTAANLRAFQTAHGIPPSGVTDAATWQALLALPPVAVDWTGGGPSA